MNFPALNGETVTTADVKICVELGHASHTIDGVKSPHCPRCGMPTDKDPALGLFSPTELANPFNKEAQTVVTQQHLVQDNDLYSRHRRTTSAVLRGARAQLVSHLYDLENLNRVFGVTPDEELNAELEGIRAALGGIGLGLDGIARADEIMEARK